MRSVVIAAFSLAVIIGATFAFPYVFSRIPYHLEVDEFPTVHVPQSQAMQSPTKRPSFVVTEAPIINSTFQGRWISTYERYPCGAKATNFCLKRSFFQYYRSKSRQGAQTEVEPFETKKGTSMCNEGMNKKDAWMEMHEPNGKGAPYPIRSRPMVLMNCWELYGYHLWLCLLATYVNMKHHHVLDPDVFVLKAGGWTKWYLGSPLSFNDSRYDDTISSPYWILFRLLTSNPKNIMPLYWMKTSQCYRVGLISAPRVTEVTPEDAQEMSRAMLVSLDLSPPPSLLHFGCSKLKAYEVVVIQRRKNFKIKNVEEVVRWIQEDTPHPTHVRVVVLENMTVREQVRVVSQAHIVIAIHGNGLTWCAVMPSGAVVIEYWPNFAYNGNYHGFSIRHNLFHIGINHGGHDCPKRCSVAFSKSKIVEALHRAHQHLQSVTCGTKIFNTSIDFWEYKKRKKEKSAKKLR